MHNQTKHVKFNTEFEIANVVLFALKKIFFRRRI